MRVDMDTSRRLIASRELEEFWITASGMRSHGDLLAAAGLGFDAALIGSSLMRGNDPGAALAVLLRADQNHA